jgi:uncharacterized membrane protein
MLSLDSYLCTFLTVQAHNTITVLAITIALLVATGQLFRYNMSRLTFMHYLPSQTHSSIKVLAVTIALLVATVQLFRYNMSRLTFIHFSNCSDTQHNNSISCNYSFTGSYWSAVQLY